MALVVVCGFPASGKTRFVEKLSLRLENEGIVSQNSTKSSSHSKNLVIVSDGLLNMNRDDIYAEDLPEVESRRMLRDQIERVVEKDSIVVFDSLNYIKGYRYEFFCLARERAVRFCMVYLSTSERTCSQWNFQREPVENRYSEEVFSDLVARFEIPSGSHRWERPLFSCDAETDSELADISGNSGIVSTVFDFVTTGAALTPAMVTRLDVHSSLSSTRRNDVERVSRQLVAAMFEMQRDGIAGGVLPNTTKRFYLPRKLSMIEFRRHQSSFVRTIGSGNSESFAKLTLDDIGNMFVEYLTNAIKVGRM